MTEQLSLVISNQLKTNKYRELFNHTFWAVLGKTTPWGSNWGTTISDTNPPLPSRVNPLMVEPAIVTKVNLVGLAYPSNCNSILLRNKEVGVEIEGDKWAVAPIELIDKLLANDIKYHFFIRVIIENKFLPTTFRCCGIYYDLKLSAPENRTVYNANLIEDYGTPVSMYYFTPVTKENADPVWGLTQIIDY